MEISQAVKDKLAEAVDLWTDETLVGRPAILANATYFSLCKKMQDLTDEIAEKFPK